MTVENLARAEISMLRYTHMNKLSQLYDSISCGESLKRSEPYAKFNPYIDDDGLLRVGGRIHNASLVFETRHPVILPRDSVVTEQIVHETCLLFSHIPGK